MTTETLSALPAVIRANSIVHRFGAKSGEVRVDCQFSPYVTLESVKENLRLETPGEAVALVPREVVGENGTFVVGFFSADIANAGHVPGSAELHWIDGDATVKLSDATVQSAASANPGGETADADNVRVPGGHPASGYPYTVGVVPIVLLAVAVVVMGVVVLT